MVFMLKIDGIFQVRNFFSKPVIKVWYEPMTGGFLSLISHFTVRFCGMILYCCVDILVNQLLMTVLQNVEYKNKFWWFGHMWKHEHSHKFPQQRLEQSMLKNYQFAKV